MSWKFWEKKEKESSAKTAYNRLQVMVNSRGNDNLDIEELKREIFAVISKHCDTQTHRPEVKYHSKDGEDYLEINVPLD